MNLLLVEFILAPALFHMVKALPENSCCFSVLGLENQITPSWRPKKHENNVSQSTHLPLIIVCFIMLLESQGRTL